MKKIALIVLCLCLVTCAALAEGALSYRFADAGEAAANFFDVFGRNTEYVIDPEETMADNFSYVIMDGAESPRYNSPEIPWKIDAWLKGEAD